MRWPLVCALMCGCYPDFSFRPLGLVGEGGAPPESSTGGESAVSTSSSTTSSVVSHASSSLVSSGSSSSSTATTSSSTGGGKTYQVPCQDPAVMCEKGKACCFHESSPELDHCAGEAPCGAGYIELRCNDSKDCFNGYKCCLRTDDAGAPSSLKCQSHCDKANEYLACSFSFECGSQATCKAAHGLSDGYKICVPVW